MTVRGELAAQLEDTAAELERAASHCRTAAEHFRGERSAPAAAHCFAACGHIATASSLDGISRVHASKASP